jgi:hypothetical protein
MAYYIRCPECAFCIGHYIDFIEKARIAMYTSVIYNEKSTYKDYHPEKIVFDPSITPSLGPLLDALNITNICCRTHIITTAKFDKQYK